MTYRAIILVPEGLTFEQLTEAQQAAINSVFGQYANPMPSTIPANGMQIVDAVTADNFDPDVMIDYGIDWPVIGMWQWDGKAEEITVVQDLDTETYGKHMPDGVVVECHRWAGWPKIIGD